MHKGLRDLAIAIGLLVAVGAVGYCHGAGHDAGALASAYDDASSQMRDSARALDTVYLRDTVVMSRLITRYETSRVTDTIVRNDTVYVRRDVADSAIAGCQTVVLSCEARVRVLSQSLAIAESTIRSAPVPRRKTSLTALVPAALAGGIIIGLIAR